MTYSVPLALVDFLPVILSALGLFALARWAGLEGAPYRQAGFLGAALVITGGTIKALWKLIIASSGVDIPWMASQLFWFMSPGFVFLAWVALAKANGGRSIFGNAWIAPALVAFLALGAAWLRPAVTGRSSGILLAVMSAASLVLTLVVLRACLQAGLKLQAGALAMNIALTFLLVRLARKDQTVLLQWCEETNNVLAQGALFFAATALLAHALKHERTTAS